MCQCVPLPPLLDRMCFPDLVLVRCHLPVCRARHSICPKELRAVTISLLLTSHCVPFMRPPRRNSCLILVPRRVVILLSNSSVFISWTLGIVSGTWSPFHFGCGGKLRNKLVAHPQEANRPSQGEFWHYSHVYFVFPLPFLSSFPSYCITEN